jgi:hypothetical protein
MCCEESSHQRAPMRSRRCSVSGRLSGETKASGRGVTRKAPLAHVEGGQAGPRRRPQPFSRILTAWKGSAGCSKIIRAVSDT